MRIGITSSNFNKEVLNSPIPVLVDIWASWCMPCLTMDKVLNTVEEKIGVKIKIVSLEMNVDNEDFIKTLGIASIPALLLYVKGKEVHRQIGVCPAETILTFIKEKMNG